jgi:histidine triad (HIT) family protein
MPTDPNCVFCKIVAGEIPAYKLLEDEATIAIMDINPAQDGHSLVISKGHYPTVFDIDPEAFAAVARSATRVAQAVNRALAPEGLNLIQANGPGAGQSVGHFHVHVLPRRHGDRLAINWEAKPGDRTRIAALAERIRALL